MPDFYPVLARAIASLPHNDGAARQDLYARARAILVEQFDGRGPTPEIKRQQEAMETAIRKVEAEARSRSTAKSLASILQILQTDEAQVPGARPTAANAPPSRLPSPDPGSPRRPNATEELRDVPQSLGSMLLSIAYIVAAIAFIGVTAIRAFVWLHQGVINYPILLAIMAIALAVFILPPLAMFRKTPQTPSVRLRQRRAI